MDNQVTVTIAEDDRAFVTALWTKVLRIPDVGVTSDFFSLGGSSMQVIEMLVLIEKHYKMQCSAKAIDYSAFFMDPTIDCLCKMLASTAPQP